MTATNPALEQELAALLGREALRTGSAVEPYLHDSTEMQGLLGRADAVVAPSSVEQVCRVVRWCYTSGMPMIPRGGGTGFAGGAVPIDGGVVVSLERLNRIREMTAELWRMEVDAGVTTGRIQRLARENGLYYPPDPGAAEQSQIGGNVACNAGGPHSFKYGTTSAWVTGIEAVVKDGRLIKVGGPLRKDAAGYNLRSLLVGSEGTLGIVTGVWLRLIPAPEVSHSVIAGYPDLPSGAAALRRIYSQGLMPATLEYFDRGCVAATRAAFPGGLPADVQLLITSEADGREEEAATMREELEQALADGATFLPTGRDVPAERELQRWRNGVSFAVSAQRGGKMSEDIAVPFESLEAAIRMVADLENEYALPTCSWGHAGDGNLHATFMIDASSADEVKQAEAATATLFARALEMGGSVSGEHGLGWVKRDQLGRQFGEIEIDLQRSIKLVFDPKNLFNPGKKVALP
ncbi:MAG TPA: FAD-linked oxidase C-terminal domain-containing protein [Candidatus Dormibacteraeota bacterium]